MSKYWFRKWLGAIRQQAITWANVDLVLCRHMVGHNELKCIFVNENLNLNKISLKYNPMGLIDNMAALVQIMAWRQTGDKPLSEPMSVCCTDAYMCQWVNGTQLYYHKPSLLFLGWSWRQLRRHSCQCGGLYTNNFWPEHASGNPGWYIGDPDHRNHHAHRRSSTLW